MKTTSLYFFAVLALVLGLSACGDPGPASAGKVIKMDLNALRSANLVADVDRFNLASIKDQLDVEALEVIKVYQKAQEGEDAAFMSNIYKNMLSANNTAQALSVKFSMSDEPVDNGVFIFSIEAQEEGALTMEMYDEEGFQMAANNKLQLTSGNNYRAVNVRDLESGQYMFRLRNSEGAELVRSLNINNN